MRGRLAVAVCFLTLPTALGQPLPEMLEGTDPIGDVQAVGRDGALLGPAPEQGFLDVTGARVEKHSSTELLFALGLVDPEGLWLRNDGNLGVSATLHFVFGGVHYFIEYADRGEACLRRFVSADRYDPMSCSPVEVQDGELVALVASTPITDLGGVKLRHPAQLSEVWAEARQQAMSLPDRTWTVTFLDRAPDVDVWGSLRTPVDPGAGPLLLTPVQGFQGSNGGGGVLLFELVADNIDAEAIDAVLTIAGLPDGWAGLVPARLHLDPGESRTIPLLVSMPFGHDHGSSVPFNVTAEVPGRQVLTEDLQVHFFDVPQPAGHHPTLYLHSGATAPGASTPVYTWIDTIQENGDDERLSFGATGGSTDYGSVTHRGFFFVPMVPDLGIGLDFDLGRTGRAQLAFQSDFATTVMARISLMHCNPSDLTGRDFAEYRNDFRCPGTWLPVLEAEPSSLSLAMGANPIDIELMPTVYADLLPLQSGALLAFVVELDYPFVPGYANSIDMLPADGRIELPLFEYQPPLRGVLADLGNLEILGEPVERSAGPGSQLVLQHRIVNHGAEALDIDFETIGSNAAWVEIQPSPMRLEAGDESPFEVKVNVPKDAGALEFAQVYVVASSQGDDQVVSVLPVRINAQGPVVHEQEQAAPTRETPVLPTALLVLSLLALAVVHRRDRPD